MNNLSMLLFDAKTIAEGTKDSFTITIYFYAITMVLALISCAIYAYYLLPRKGIKGELIIDIMIAVIPCAIVGARTWYVIMEFDEFINAPDGFWKEAFNIAGGGLAIHGGIMGGALGLFIISKIRKINLLKLCDVGATLLPLGQAIGRWGNFFNQEVYGMPTDVTWFPFSVYIEKTGQYHYALFFYEMVLNLILLGLLLIFFYNYKGKRDLYSGGFYFIGYGAIRMFMEPFRASEFQMAGGLSVITALVMLAIGVVIIAYLLYKDIGEKNYWWKDFFKKQSAVAVQAGNQQSIDEQINHQSIDGKPADETVKLTETTDNLDNKEE